MHNKMKRIVLVICCLLLAGLMIGCASEAEAKQEYQTIEDFTNAKIGIMTGSSHDGTVREHFPEAERVYFSAVADMVLAVEQGKIDCYIEDAPFTVPVLWEGASIKQVEGVVKYVENAFVFPKEQEKSQFLKSQINEFIDVCKEDGTINQLKAKWLGDTEPTEHPDYTTLTGENGTIHLAIVVDSKPIVYIYNQSYTGFEIELLTMFAQEYGYNFKFEVVPFDSAIAGVVAGKYDMAASSFNITPERQEVVDFSDPYSRYEVILVTKDDGAVNASPKKTLADFEHATIGVMTGSSYDPLARERFPEAEHAYYSLMPDLVLAVEQGKVDGFISEGPYVTASIWEGAGIEALDEVIERTQAGYIFQKDGSNTEVKEQLNTFLRDWKANGKLAALNEKWTRTTEPTEFFDFDTLTGENGTLKVAISPDLKPLCYMKNDSVTGYEIEILGHFALEYGYQLEFIPMVFDAILPGVMTGKYDIGTGGMTITEERAQSVDFTESYQTVDVVMAVKAQNEKIAQTDFWGDLQLSFEKTFIREDRWKLIVSGTGVTVLISLCAALFGSLLGFGLYMLSRSEVKSIQMAAKSIAKVYSRIVAGTPVVVILMILFYVVFGSFRDISGILVAIIGFTLTFGAFVYDHMTVSVDSVDNGQTEAAYALGYSRNQTFFRIILPQAMSVFMPSYCGQAVDLVKATAIVGYVAVNDLTKMGDIIRSNTYEAFFPLIATAVIYFLLTWIFALLLGVVKRRFEPKRRSEEEILKGVKTI